MRAGKFGGFVIAGIAVGEAIRHDQINQIAGRKSLISASDRFAREAIGNGNEVLPLAVETWQAVVPLFSPGENFNQTKR